MNRTDLHLPQTIGDQIADRTVGTIGTWRFLILQSAVLALWILLNSVGWFSHWDSAPFILLNLCLSFQAAFTGPIVLLSQNRQAAKDHARDDLEAQEVQSLFEHHALLLTINQQQLEILEALRTQALSSPPPLAMTTPPRATRKKKEGDSPALVPSSSSSSSRPMPGV